MGYRSEVRCIIYGPKEKLDAFLVTHSLIFQTPAIRHFKDSLTRYTINVFNSLNDNTIFHVLDLYGDYWKWYPEYEDVQSWHGFMDDADEFGLEYEFIRIGEGDGDQPDVETHYSAEQPLYLLSVGRPTITDSINKLEEVPLNL